MLQPHCEQDDRSARVGGDSEATLIPAWRTLSGFAIMACDEAVALVSLAPGTVLLVHTRNSEYRLTVLGGSPPRLLVQGGSLFATPTPADLQGATAGGNLVRTGWIEVGRHMELRCGSRRVITSPVLSVSVESEIIAVARRI